MPSSSKIGFLVLLFVATMTTTTGSISDNNNNTVNSNLSTDKSALDAFKSYYITTDPRSILKNGWSDSESVCNWTGVTCGGNPLRVVGLNLDSQELAGTVPPHLGNLTSLVELGLRNNSFQGSIPCELSRLKRVEIISLEFNDLIGEIPHGIGSLPKLRKLDLSENRLSGNVPEEIRSLHLEILQLYNNVLTGPLPQFVFNMSSLKVLALSGNNFFGKLPDNLCQNLAKNSFHGDIPKSIANLTTATEIHLGRNKLTGTVSKEIAKLPNLESLALGFNNINGVVPPEIFNITTLIRLGLQYNQISGSLPPNFGIGFPNLEILYIYENDLTGSLPDSISNASQLTHLEVGGNHFSGFIPETVSALKNLEFLSFYDNNLTLIKSSSDRLLSSIATLSHLRVISLAKTSLNVPLPSSIGSNASKSLQRAYLYDCNLGGQIPASLGNFTSLILLTLEGNALSGSIPPSIGMLRDLQGLGLSQNILDGPIPQELCQLQSINALALFNNMLSGSIPRCLGNATSLRKLYLASNKLTSAIPPTIWGIKDILEVNFSSNSLTGSLPNNIGNLKALVYFAVSNNRLSGNISSTIGDLGALQELHLNNNTFQGSIPDSMGKLLSLKRLDLSRNNLFGVIPKSMENLSQLTFLNLSFNKLSGEIPSGGPFSNFSFRSFIHNDNLCGALRLQVPPCKSVPPRKSNNRLILKWLLPLVIGAALLLVVPLLIIAFRRKTSRMPDSEVAIVSMTRVSKFELSAATNGFKEENLVGVGGFGSVYKGTLHDGVVVAIKVFNLQVEEAFKTFASECEVLCTVRHRNLVKIITCCSSPDFKALVLQYMPNGSLEKWLYSDGLFLNVSQRLDIMIDVASALEYLHYGCLTPIVHCDLKPSNVLLDENMVAHVADFGIAKLLCGEDTVTQTMTMATVGYMAPEYGVGGVVSRRGDLYSFGIMLMEVFTKKKPTDEMFSEKMDLKEWIKNSIQDENSEAIDPELLAAEETEDLTETDCVPSILKLALSCAATPPEERVDIKIVVSTLEKIKKSFLENE